MYINTMKNTLKIETTDYEIDQAAVSIECMSDEHAPKEKMMLWDEVKRAKQLSQSRNLLQNGDFGDFSGSDWTFGNDIIIGSNNPVFEGKFFQMRGA